MKRRARVPIYGSTYLPRKFKIALAIPPHNDVDLYANDLGFVALSVNRKLVGFNVFVGGGMGSTHGDKATYPQIARGLGFISPEDAIAVSEAVVTAQRDFPATGRTASMLVLSIRLTTWVKMPSS